MHKFKKRRPFQLLLTAGLCLGALNSTGAALWLEEPVRPPVAPVVEFQETEVPVPSPEEEARAAAERAARQSRAAALLAGKQLTREQLVTMLWRFKGSPYVNIDNLGQFKDAAEVSGWAVQPVRWAVANGLLNGASGSLIPQGRATRAEVAAILARFCQNVG